MNQAPIAACFGRRGVGKTTLARGVTHHQARPVVWDYMNEYGPLAYRVENGRPEALAAYLRSARGQRFAAARYVPQTGDVEEFERFCEVVYRSENLLVVIEEAAAICQASYLPPAFGRIVRTGRHRGLGLLWSRRQVLAPMRRNGRKLAVLGFLASWDRPATVQEIAWGIRLPYPPRGLHRHLKSYGLVRRTLKPDGKLRFWLAARGRARLAWLRRRERLAQAAAQF